MGDGGSTTAECVTVCAADSVPSTGAVPVYTCDANKSTKYPDGPSACRNATDCAIINTGEVRNIVRECGLSCLQPSVNCPVESACNAECVREATKMKIMPPGISNGCGKCYTDITLCSRAFCLMDCVGGADLPGCVKCQFEKGCRVPFEQCSGLDRQ
jgi:hypothetical protein